MNERVGWQIHPSLIRPLMCQEVVRTVFCSSIVKSPCSYPIGGGWKERPRYSLRVFFTVERWLSMVAGTLISSIVHVPPFRI